MDFHEYRDEINLIQAQNDTEFELYPLVAELIAPTLRGLSKRYVFARRISELGQIYFGISGFPDIAILDKDFNNQINKDITPENWHKLKGCVEVKAYGNKLYTLKQLKEEFDGGNPNTEAFQLIGEVLWYKKLLYTNGAEWKLFKFEDYKVREEFIIKIVKKRIANGKNKKYDWYRSDEILKMIRNNIKEIKEIKITDDCQKNWNEFIEKIGALEWQ